jgi:hypothetical protein
VGLILNKAQAEAVANAMAHLNNVGATARIQFPHPGTASVRVSQDSGVAVWTRAPSGGDNPCGEDYPTQHDFLVAYGLE